MAENDRLIPYFETDLGVLYHGDCLEIMPQLPKVDLVLTDPPYGVGLGSHPNAKEQRRWVGLKKQAYLSYNDTRKKFLSAVVPAVKMAVGMTDRAVVFCVGSNMWDMPRPDVVSAIYLPSGKGRTRWGFQNFAHFLLYGKAPNLNMGAKNIAIKSTARAEKCGHPCPKPTEWLLWLVGFASLDGDLILDPFPWLRHNRRGL
jgi:DNA modification methylase